MLTRRDVLRALAAAGVTTVAGVPAGLLGAPAGASADPWKTAFDDALAKNPRLLGWKSVGAERLDTPALDIEGRLPTDLAGTFYRMGPARHERAGKRYHHWFDGDGMAQAFRFDGSAVSHRGRFVDTRKRRDEQEAGRFIYPGFATPMPDGRGLARADDMNPANINLLAFDDELLALWEGGSAHSLDPASLETRGIKVWSKQLSGVPFSAHYKREPDGTVWNFGAAFGQKLLVLYKIAPDGTLIAGDGVALPELPFASGMVHDFAVTERHIVFVLSPFVFEPEAVADGAYLDGFVWRPELGSRALVIDKNDWTARRWHDLPAGFSFHFGNAWEEPGGTIRFTYCVAEDGSILSETFAAVMRGEWRPPTAPTRFAHVTLPPRGPARQEIAPLAAEFPRVAPAVVGARHRFEYCLTRISGTEGWNPYGTDGRTGVARQDHETGAMSHFEYGDHELVEEHIFVPKPGARGEGDGWVIGTTLDVTAGVTRVNLFEAGALADGPVVRASLPYPLPLGFHGQWQAT